MTGLTLQGFADKQILIMPLYYLESKTKKPFDNPNIDYISLVEESQIEFSNDNYQRSLDLIMKAIQLSPDTIDALIQLFDIYWTAGFIQKAKDVCDAIKNKPHPSDNSDVLKIKCCIQLCEYSEALVLLEKYRNQHPESRELNFNKGLIEFESCRWKEALKHFSKASADDDFNAEKMENLTRKILLLSRWIQLVPIRSAKRFIIRLIRLYALKKQNLDWRMVCTRLLIQIFPGEAIHHLHLGQMINSSGSLHAPEWESAGRCYTMALEKQPDFPEVFFFWGVNRYDHGQFVLADECFQKLKPDSEMYRESLKYRGNCQVIAGNLDSAAHLYEEFLGIDPTGWPVWLNLACVRYMQDSLDAALSAVKKGLDCDPEIKLLLYLEQVLTLISQNGSISRSKAHAIFQELTKVNHWTLGIYPQNLKVKQMNPKYFHNVPCPVCDSLSHRPVYDNGWMVVKCNSCGLLFINPQPSQEFLYQKYSASVDKKYPLRRYFRRLLNHIVNMPTRYSSRWMVEDGLLCRNNSLDFLKFERSLKNPKMLDIGAAVGWQTYSFQLRGWDACGLEISKDDVEYGRKMGVNLIEGSVETMDFPEASFNLITMTHAIEHFTEPLDSLRKIARILQPGGLLMISTPCADSLPYYFCGPEWLIHGEHVFYFSRETLSRLVEKAGFTVIETMTFCGASTRETHQPFWVNNRFNSLVGSVLESFDQGDVVVLYATLGDHRDRFIRSNE